MTFDEIEAQLTQDAAKFAGLKSLVKFDFGDAGVLFVDATQSPPAISREGGEPRTTIVITTDNFSKLSAGRLSPMMAFTMGKLKIQGDMGMAMKLASILED
jgi:putative sterol carrier protein